MAYTYSSWEYSQGPNLYIDSSGFKSINDDKTFVYYYIVTYSPVEYRRKVTDEKGVSTYEFKYTFGDSMVSRKVLEEVTFNGKEKMTKTVTHSVIEEGYRDSITKTFYIDTNIHSNIETNKEFIVDPSAIIQITDWKFDASKTITLPTSFNGTARGWKTQQETGYRTQAYTSYSSGSSWSGTGASVTDHPSTWTLAPRTSIGYYDGAIKTGETKDYTYWKYKGNDYRSENDGGDVYKKTYYSYSYTSYRTVSYTYNQDYGTYGKINIKAIRDMIDDRQEYSALTVRLRTNTKLNKAPKVSIDTAQSATSSRQTLQCKTAGELPANELIEYYLPLDVIFKTFANSNEAFLFIHKGDCSSTEVYFHEAYIYLDVEVNVIPFVNLMVQAYDALTDRWFDACIIPYLNYKEINAMRKEGQHISKNLFFPTALPKTDSSYRIQLDTNLIAKDLEQLTNFRIDVLSKQLIPPGFIEDKKIYLNNDTTSNDMDGSEIEVARIDDLKLNVIGSLNYKATTYPGFLVRGANDVHAYIRNSVYVDEEGVSKENISKNNWYDYVSEKNGNWISNEIFVANTYELPKVDLLQKSKDFAQDKFLTFKIPYRELKSNATYQLKFDIEVERSFSIPDGSIVNESDKNNISKAIFYSTSNYNTAKVKVRDEERIIYSPEYRIKSGNSTEYISEVDLAEKTLSINIVIETKNLYPSDTEYFTISLNRKLIKNIIVRRMRCLCIDKDGVKHIDVVEPYNAEVSMDRQCDTSLTIYYDGFHIEEINPLLYNDMVYLRSQLDSIRYQYEIPPYEWSDWEEKYSNNDLVTDEYGHGFGVNKDQPLRAIHFNDVKKCCLDTYEKLLQLRPPVILNTNPTIFRESTGLIPLNDNNISEGYVLQHVQDREGNPMEIDKYFPEWRKIIELINRN